MQKEYKAFKITSIVFYVITILFVMGAYAFLIYARNPVVNEGEQAWGEALGAVILWLYLSMGAGVTMIIGFAFSLVGLILCNKKVLKDGVLVSQGKQKSKKEFTFLCLFSLIIIATWLVLLIIFKNV